MWVSRVHYESMFENLTRERTKSDMLSSRLSAMTATQDWLMEHVNRLEHERGILIEARLGLVFPVPSIERAERPGVETPTPPGIDPGSVHGTPDDSIPLAQMLASSMDDMGDDAAGRMGIAHDAQGMLVYKQ
jgi:hypothetical protein